MLPAETTSALFDELEKIAISSKLLRIAQSRKGRRPMSVSTLLKKEKEGTLYKHSQVIIPYLDGPRDPGAAKRSKRKGDVPSRDDPGVEKREDGRDFAATIPGVGLIQPGGLGTERTQ